MEPSFSFIEGITRADIAFQATGNTLEEVFRQSALATFEVQCDPNTIKKVQRIPINLQSFDKDQLLIDFLSQILYHKDADQLMFCDVKLSITEKDKNFTLTGEFIGDFIDHDSQELRNDVKAVTYHEFYLEKLEEGFKAQVVLDI